MVDQLPNNWVETEVGQLSSIIRGISYKKQDAQAIKDEGDFLVLRGGNIQGGKIDFTNNDLVYVRAELVKETQKIRRGDVVIVGSTGSKKLIGKAAIINQDYEEISFGAFLMLIRPHEPINSKYFDYFFISDNYRRVIRELAGGININNIRKQYITGLKFPVPPVQEQKRIVAKLDDLFGHLEEVKTRLDLIPDLLKNFRQAILNQAVTGKLTEEWRGSRSVNGKLLSKKLIQHHLDVGGHKKGNAAKPDLEKHSDSFDSLPQDWDLIELREICHREKPITYGILKPGPETDNGRAYLKVMSYPNNEIDFNKVRHTTVEIEENYKRARLKTGDIVLSIRGTVGRVIIIPSELNGANITQDSARISVQNEMNNIFVSFCLKSPILKNVMDSVTKGVAVRGINIGDVRHLRIPIPDITEQNEIVKRVETLFSKANEIDSKFKTLKQKTENLPQAILAKAFKGELVEQLPSDGDARELLKEIEALKAEFKPKKRSKK